MTQQKRLDILGQLQADALLLLEAQLLGQLLGPIRRALAAWGRNALGRWLLHHDTAGAVAELQQLEHTHLAADLLVPQLRAIGARGWHAGAGNAWQQIGQHVPLPARDEFIDQLAPTIAKAAAAWARRAADALVAADSDAGVQQAVATAQRAATSVSEGASMAFNAGANGAVHAVAVRVGQLLMWQAERDACVVCAALSGHVIDPNAGEAFDEEATFGIHAPPPVWPPGMPLVRPPRHPHCRCWIVVYTPPAGVPQSLTLPARLQYEALRNILKGWSLESESNATRLAAAEKLLRSGRADVLPKSVRAAAESAVGRRRFASRTVPSTR